MTIIIQHMNNKPMNDDNNNDNEQHMMLPLEVEHYYETNEVDAKNTGFLDEYKENELPKENPHFKQTKLVWVIFIGSIFSALLLFGIRRSSRSPVLRFRFGTEHHGNNLYHNRTFQIMQITDIHLGEAEYTDWGPLQDQKTMLLLDTIFAIEKPDLIVLGGDQLTANNCLQNCTEYYKILGRFLSNYNIPWATIMGNHDDMDFEVEDGTGTTIPHSVGLRKELLQTDQRFPLSLSQNSLNNVTGVTNYVLDVFDPVTDNISLQIFLLDSGGGSMREAIEDDQVQWLRKAATTDTRTAAVPAVAFQHIPTYAHQYVDDACFGYQGEGIAGLTYDGGIIDAMTEAGRFHFLAVGHNHGNDYCCPNNSNNDDNKQENDLYFCFGRHSGYGGYGKWDRGVRMYEFLLTNEHGGNNELTGGAYDTANTFQWRTWVRLESGAKIDFMDYDHSIIHEDRQKKP